jgi:hypothetical protein
MSSLEDRKSALNAQQQRPRRSLNAQLNEGIAPPREISGDPTGNAKRQADTLFADAYSRLSDPTPGNKRAAAADVKGLQALATQSPTATADLNVLSETFGTADANAPAVSATQKSASPQKSRLKFGLSS